MHISFNINMYAIDVSFLTSLTSLNNGFFVFQVIQLAISLTLETVSFNHKSYYRRTGLCTEIVITFCTIAYLKFLIKLTLYRNYNLNLGYYKQRQIYIFLSHVAPSRAIHDTISHNEMARIIFIRFPFVLASLVPSRSLLFVSLIFLLLVLSLTGERNTPSESIVGRRRVSCALGT